LVVVDWVTMEERVDLGQEGSALSADSKIP